MKRRSPARKIGAKILRWTLRALVVLLVVLALLLTLLLYSSGFLRLVLTTGLGFYNDRIPGEIRIDRVEGRLADHLVLADISLVDRHGRALVAAHELSIRWHPWALLRGVVEVEALELSDVQVTLIPGGFADLVIPGPPEAPRDSILPVLPIDLEVAALRLADLDIIAADTRAAVVGDLRLALRDLSWSGRDARLEIVDAAGQMPGVTLEALTLAVHWSEPTLELSGLVTTDLARAELLRMQLDVATLAGRALIAVDGRDALAGRLGGAIGEQVRAASGAPRLRLDARSAAGELDLGVRFELPGRVALDLAASGPLRGAPHIALRGLAAIDPVAVGWPLRASFSASVAGPDWSRLRAEVSLRCGECGALSGLEAHALARRDATLDASAGQLELAGAGMALRARAEVGARGIEAGHWDLTVRDLGVPASVGRLFADIPPLNGVLATRGSCTGVPLRCEGTLKLDRFAGYGVGLAELRAKLAGEPRTEVARARAELSARGLRLPGYRFAGAEVIAEIGAQGDGGPVGLVGSVEAELWARRRGRGDRALLRAQVRAGPPLVIDLEALALQLRGLQARLRHPARVELAARRIEVDELALRVAGGAVAVRGHADLDGDSRVHVAIDRVRLAPLAALVPGLRGQVGGRVSASASLEGRARRPAVALALEARHLRYRDGVIGGLDLAVRLAASRGRAVLGVHGPLARRFTATAALPLDLDLSRGALELRRGPVHLDLAAKDLRLAALAPWLGLELRLGGSVDAGVTVDGPAARPTTAIAMHGRAVQVGEQDAPADFDLVLTQRSGEDTRGHLEARRLGGRLGLELIQLPVRVDLVHGGLHWWPTRRHVATLMLRDFDLGPQLAARTGVAIAGRVELVGVVDGPMTEPGLQLMLRGEALRVRDARFGTLHADLRLARRQAALDLTLRGEVIHSGTIHAELPLRLAPARGEFTWLKGQPHVLDLKIERLDLARIEALGVAVKMAGLVDLGAELRGPMQAPALALRGDLRGFVWQHRPVGRAHAELAYRDGRAALTLRSALGCGRVEGRASLPLAVDLPRGRFEWDAQARSEVLLRVDDLDARMLAPLWRVPDDALIGLDLQAQASGTATDFHGTVEGCGRLGARAVGAAPVQFSATIDPNRQSLHASLGPHRSAGEIEVEVDLRADLGALARRETSAGQSPFTASIQARSFDARFVQGFVPRTLYDLRGMVNAWVDAKGTLAEPEVDGGVKLRGGGITVLALQQRIHDVELDLRVNGRRLVLERLAAESGRGRLDAGGTADILRDGGLRLEGEAQLRKFPLVRPGLPQMQIDARVAAQVVASAGATDVKVQVHDTRVAVTGYTNDPPRSIPTNPNVVFAGQQVLVAVATSSGVVAAANELRDAPPDEPAPNRRLALHIALADPVQIRGPAVEMVWRGAVTVDSAGEGREVTGELTADEGRFDLLGNHFQLVSGTVTLPEDEHTVDPFVAIVARTSTAAAEVTATFKGRLSRPELTFSADPAMAQDQILTLLLTGSPDASEADEGRVLAQAAVLLATFENPALTSFLSARLGIDRIGLSFGDDVTQPILSIGKQLTKNIYAETAFKFNAPRNRNRVEVRVEFELSRHWMLETFFGDAAVGGVDLFWHSVFGQPRRIASNPGPAPGATGQVASPRGDAQAPAGAGSDGGGGVR